MRKIVDYGDMEITSCGIKWEVEYEIEFGGHVILNNVMFSGEEFFDLLDDKILMKIQDEVAVELAERRAHERSWADEAAEYHAEYKREMREAM